MKALEPRNAEQVKEFYRQYLRQFEGNGWRVEEEWNEHFNEWHLRLCDDRWLESCTFTIIYEPDIDEWTFDYTCGGPQCRNGRIFADFDNFKSLLERTVKLS